MISDPYPTFEELLDWLEGRLEPDVAAEVAQAAEGDEATAETVRWIRVFESESREQQLADPPDWMRHRLQRLFAAHLSAGRPGLRTVLALLSFDSRLGGELAGVRSAAKPAGTGGEPFQLAARAGEFDVVLEVTPITGGARIDGQVLAGRTVTGPWLAAVEHPGGRVTAEPGDDQDCFVIVALPLDADRLVLDNGEVVIVVDLPVLDR